MMPLSYSKANTKSISRGLGVSGDASQIVIGDADDEAGSQDLPEGVPCRGR